MLSIFSCACWPSVCQEQRNLTSYSFCQFSCFTVMTDQTRFLQTPTPLPLTFTLIIQFTSLSGDFCLTHTYHEFSLSSSSLICSLSPFLIPSYSICEPKNDASISQLRIMSGARDIPLSRKDVTMEVKFK